MGVIAAMKWRANIGNGGQTLAMEGGHPQWREDIGNGRRTLAMEGGH